MWYQGAPRSSAHVEVERQSNVGQMLQAGDGSGMESPKAFIEEGGLSTGSGHLLRRGGCTLTSSQVNNLL